MDKIKKLNEFWELTWKSIYGQEKSNKDAITNLSTYNHNHPSLVDRKSFICYLNSGERVKVYDLVEYPNLRAKNSDGKTILIHVNDIKSILDSVTELRTELGVNTIIDKIKDNQMNYNYVIFYKGDISIYTDLEDLSKLSDKYRISKWLSNMASHDITDNIVINYLLEDNYGILIFKIIRRKNKIPFVRRIAVSRNSQIDQTLNDTNLRKAISFFVLNGIKMGSDLSIFRNYPNSILRNIDKKSDGKNIYHGTTHKYLTSIMNTGLLPNIKHGNTHFDILHPSTIFMSTDLSVALSYSVKFSEKHSDYHVVIEIDKDKIDKDKLVVDYDHYFINIKDIEEDGDIENYRNYIAKNRLTNLNINKAGYNGKILPLQFKYILFIHKNKILYINPIDVKKHISNIDKIYKFNDLLKYLNDNNIKYTKKIAFNLY